jgi:hypothetical protein
MSLELLSRSDVCVEDILFSEICCGHVCFLRFERASLVWRIGGVLENNRGVQFVLLALSDGVSYRAGKVMKCGKWGRSGPRRHGKK